MPFFTLIASCGHPVRVLAQRDPTARRLIGMCERCHRATRQRTIKANRLRRMQLPQLTC